MGPFSEHVTATIVAISDHVALVPPRFRDTVFVPNARERQKRPHTTILMCVKEPDQLADS